MKKGSLYKQQVFEKKGNMYNDSLSQMITGSYMTIIKIRKKY